MQIINVNCRQQIMKKYRTVQDKNGEKINNRKEEIE